jgi:hypothetical protein
MKKRSEQRWRRLSFVQDRTDDCNTRSNEFQKTVAQPKMVDVEPVELSFATVQPCYVCGKKGHSTESSYRRNKTPKNEWYINRVKQQQQGMEHKFYPADHNYATATAFYDLKPEARLQECNHYRSAANAEVVRI